MSYPRSNKESSVQLDLGLIFFKPSSIWGFGVWFGLVWFGLAWLFCLSSPNQPASPPTPPPAQIIYTLLPRASGLSE